ncbi:hypothetical protein [Herbiconiux sp.]|jgi:hypothetical protein|uniref:hypothetical protein n=1 Tax=Herbiconiux sp. TaxID=1871186 RepID=UPI0025C5C033|nr:hypothetical protein [Herbiconiux sp.]
MKSVKYGTETFITSDEVADALMAYAATLRGMDHGQLLTVPTIEDDGSEGSISILVGPGIPMLSRPSVSEVAEPEAIALIEQMLQLTVVKTGTLRAEPDAAPAAEIHE